MIKIQPAHSRILKSEQGDRLTLAYPAKGLLSFGGGLILLGLVWSVPWVWMILALKNQIAAVAAGFLMIPGFCSILAGVAGCLARWSIERSAESVIFRRGGLLGSRVRKWPAQDVSSLWVDILTSSDQSSVTTTSLILGFRNGRQEELLTASNLEEDLQWVAAMVSEPRGERRVVPGSVRAVAEPVARRTGPSVMPASIAVRKEPTGVELTFLPLLDFGRRWWKLLAETLLGVFTLVILAQILVQVIADYPAWITRVAIALWLVLIVGRLAMLLQTTVIQVLDGEVRIVQNQHRERFHFASVEVEYVQTFRTPAHTELQFLLRGRPKVRVLHDRPADELEWAARFLRVAIKGRAPEQAESMKMDVAAGECQVCGEKMESRVIFCAKCRTPHHEECWSYVGQCSTFGCREIRFTRA